ncbi:MAG TPA: thioesterase family protein [Solirubrobacteraceae bacterium]|nr:thioesterase family protein [Solirubrobacteraceae bacterium]
MSDAIFTRDGDRHLPSAHARGPWDPRALHGGAPAALLAEEIARAGDDHGAAMAVARLTCEFLGPVPLAPLTIAADVVRPGRRFQLVEGEVRDASGTPVLRARAVRLRRGAVELPADRGRADGPPGGSPAAAGPSPFAAAPGEDPHAFHLSGMELRVARGAGDLGPGRARVWFRLAMPLVAGREPSPLARVVAAADFGNGASRVLDWNVHLFVNTDLTVSLHREPAGEWVLLDATTRVEPEGRGLAWSVLHDERGPLGVATQTLFVAAR